jgi:hypothetical protein
MRKERTTYIECSGGGKNNTKKKDMRTREEITNQIKDKTRFQDKEGKMLLR